MIRTLSEKYDGGLKKLASDIGMSEANLHRCINNNKIQASDLESIAIKLNVDISIFFDGAAVKFASHDNQKGKNGVDMELLLLCKSLVDNYQQRDEMMSKLFSMVKGKE